MNGKVIVAGILLIVFGVGAYALYDLKLSPEMKAAYRDVLEERRRRILPGD